MKKVIVMIGLMACLAAELQSCHPPPPKHHPPRPDPRTTIFSGYLKSTFKQEIPAEQHYYLLVPKTGCQGAIINTLSQITSAGVNSKSSITIITSNKPVVTKYLHVNWPILQDGLGDLDVLNLPVTNVSLISTKDGRVDAIHSSEKCESDIGSKIVAVIRYGEKK